MSKNLTVSAIITTCNRPNFLARAIDSVLSQTFECIEIIIIDDYSENETCNLVARYIERCKKIRYERLPERSGACRARNRGRELASGDLIAGLDDDDVWSPKRIEVLVNAYHSKYAFVTSQDTYVQGENRWVSDKPETITLANVLYANCVGNQVLVSKSKLDRLGGFDESLPAAQDYDMWIRLIEQYGAAKVIDEALQDVFIDDTPGRITNSSRKFLGYFMCYKKHKHLLNTDQRKAQLANLWQARGKRVNFKTFAKLRSSYNKQVWFWVYATQHKMWPYVRGLYRFLTGHK
jgi:glycosyltransferase involved in cell wall biosynthesis